MNFTKYNSKQRVCSAHITQATASTAPTSNGVFSPRSTNFVENASPAHQVPNFIKRELASCSITLVMVVEKPQPKSPKRTDKSHRLSRTAKSMRESENSTLGAVSKRARLYLAPLKLGSSSLLVDKLIRRRARARRKEKESKSRGPLIKLIRPGQMRSE
jgi:hypothetical protein